MLNFRKCGDVFRGIFWVALAFAFTSASAQDRAENEGAVLRVASYNLQNYLEMDRLVEGQFRMGYPKREVEKSVVRETIREAAADILAVQEIGSLEHLVELRDDLRREGLDYSGVFALQADDEARLIGALWKENVYLQPVAHVDLGFNLYGERRLVKRGLLELRVGNSSGDEATLSIFVLHLKSRYTIDQRDPSATVQRTKEAEAVRDRILELYPDPNDSRFLIVGDLNDQRNSAPLRRFANRGDLEIARICDAYDSRGEIWTHYYRKGGEYSLIDYILASPLSHSEVVETGIIDREDFFSGSDHRLVWVDVASVK